MGTCRLGICGVTCACDEDVTGRTGFKDETPGAGLLLIDELDALFGGFIIVCEADCGNFGTPVFPEGCR